MNELKKKRDGLNRTSRRRVFAGLMSLALLAGCGVDASETGSSGLDRGGSGGSGGSSNQGTSTGRGKILVANRTSKTVLFMYLSPASSSSWGSDILGARTLNPSRSLEITNVTPGRYDFKAELQGGTTATLYGFTVEADRTFQINVR